MKKFLFIILFFGFGFAQFNPEVFVNGFLFDSNAVLVECPDFALEARDTFATAINSDASIVCFSLDFNFGLIQANLRLSIAKTGIEPIIIQPWSQSEGNSNIFFGLAESFFAMDIVNDSGFAVLVHGTTP